MIVKNLVVSCCAAGLLILATASYAGPLRTCTVVDKGGRQFSATSRFNACQLAAAKCNTFHQANGNVHGTCTMSSNVIISQ